MCVEESIGCAVEYGGVLQIVVGVVGEMYDVTYCTHNMCGQA